MYMDMRVTRWAVAAAIALTAIVNAGCGSDEDRAAPAAAKADLDAWAAGAGPEWKQTLDAARKEGQVVLVGPPELAQSSFAEDFKRDTGIELVLSAGESSQRGQGMRQEASSNKLGIDIALGGAGEMFDMLPSGLLKPVKPQLMLENVTDPAQWKDGLKFVDKEQKYLLQGASSVWSGLWVNGDNVDPASIDSWQDLLDPKFTGKIAAYDPRAYGLGLAAATAYAEAFGPEFVEQLYGEQDVTLSLNRRQLSDWLARGRYDIVIGAVQADIERLRSQGINVAALDPADGPQFLSGGSSVIKQPQNKNGTPGPHPNAATVFINWYAGRPGQMAYAQAMRDVSLREDVPVQSGVPEYVVPNDAREDLDTFTYDFWMKMPQTQKAVSGVLG